MYPEYITTKALKKNLCSPEFDSRIEFLAQLKCFHWSMWITNKLSLDPHFLQIIYNTQTN